MTDIYMRGGRGDRQFPTALMKRFDEGMDARNNRKTDRFVKVNIEAMLILRNQFFYGFFASGEVLHIVEKVHIRFSDEGFIIIPADAQAFSRQHIVCYLQMEGFAIDNDTVQIKYKSLQTGTQQLASQGYLFHFVHKMLLLLAGGLPAG